MVEKLYYVDPYLKHFEAAVRRMDHDRIFLDRTAFYPGGGGQANDLGTIDGRNVTEVGKDGEDIYHTVPGASSRTGQEVRCDLDWNRRYELMRGHSGQHILFRAMQEQNPELAVGKVDIGIEKKVLFFNGEMSWSMLRKALAKANEIIAADMDIIVEEVPRDSKILKDVRIKADRILGEKVRIVRVGGFDAAACGGVHVRKTGEIGGLAILRLASGRQASDWNVQFEIGLKALTASSDLAVSTLAIADMLGCAPENVEATVGNLKTSEAAIREKLKAASQERLDELQPERIQDYSLYSALLLGADRKTMNEVSSRLIRQEGAIVLLCDVSENVFMVVACNEKIALDCPALLNKGLSKLNGRGGGKRNFAQGGGSEIALAEEAFRDVRQSISDIIASEFSCG